MGEMMAELRIFRFLLVIDSTLPLIYSPKDYQRQPVFCFYRPTARWLLVLLVIIVIDCELLFECCSLSASPSRCVFVHSRYYLHKLVVFLYSTSKRAGVLILLTGGRIQPNTEGQCTEFLCLPATHSYRLIVVIIIIHISCAQFMSLNSLTLHNRSFSSIRRGV